MHQKYGLATPGDAAEARLKEQESFIRDSVFEGVSAALQELKPEAGRLDNQRRAARRLILAVASANIPGSLRGVASKLLSTRTQTLRESAGLLDDLL